MLSRSPPGLRGLLALAFGAVALAVAAVTALLSAQAASEQARAQAAETLDTFAHGLAARLDREMFERWRDIRVLASNAVLRSQAQSPDAIRAVLRRLDETYPDYAIIAFMDPSGRVVADSRKLAEGADASARTIFLRAKERAVVEDVHEAIVLARLLPRQADGLPPRFIDVAAPVVSDDGDLVGVVAGHLYWQWAEGIARQFREAVGPQRRIEPMIISAAGNVLLGPEDLQGKQLPSAAALPGSVRWPDGRDYLSASVQTRGYLDYPGLGWTVVVRQPVEIAEARTEATTGQILASGLLAALIAAPLGWLLAWWMTHPLASLAAVSKRAHLFEEPAQFPRQVARAPYREARILAEALEHLVERLREGQQSVAMLVREADHRLKNSLQSIASILAVQARKTDDIAARAAFADAIARVRTVAEVHRALYRADGMPGEQVGLSTMLQDLCRQHAETALRPGIEIEFEAKGDCKVDGRQAMAIGLLVAELITNAGKHAFPDTRIGTVRVMLQEHEGALEVAVEDDGVGMPVMSAGESRGLGRSLVQNLARQAGGELATMTAEGGGTRLVLRIAR